MLGIIILAAGQGKRMNSSIPKVMHKVAGRSMLEHVLDAVHPLNAFQTIVVTSDNLIQYIDSHPIPYPVDFADQGTPLGTGHAVQMAMPYLKSEITEVIILCGDTPLIRSESLKKLSESKSDLTLFGMILEGKEIEKPYGRLVLENDIVKEIVEMKDATPDQQRIPFANSGVYKVSVDVLKDTLSDLKNDNESKEYYLTDMVKIAALKNYKTKMIEADYTEFFGINTRSHLSKAEELLQDRLRELHMENGVTLIDPKSTFFDVTTKVGKDVTIYPNVMFGKNVIIEDNVTLYSNCYIEESLLKPYSKVGPFAHLRGGCVLEEKAEVGNFVELKKTILGVGSKAKHLSYLGDASVGEKVNIGAGVITCNYNGFKKFKTIIQDNVFVGSNSALVAPITLSEGSIVGAGSTITKDVPKDAISLTRPDQVTKENAALAFKKRYKKD